MNLSDLLEIVKISLNMVFDPFYTSLNESGASETALNPAFVFFWVIVFVIAFQYRRIARSREAVFGIHGHTVFRDTLLAAFYGLLGGLMGSILLYVTGVSLSEGEIIFLWPVAILLALFNPRFLCFSYAGGIISVSYLLFHYPEVRVPQLMGLVAVLHMIESLLILFSGHLGATPIYLKHKNDRILGGYTLQKFWPIPLAVAVAGNGLQPIVAGLGYGDLALARKPGDKSRISAFYLSAFSLVLLLFSLMAKKHMLFAWLAALFSPLGHEMVIHLGQRVEFKERPVFVPTEKGVKLLAVFPGTPADRAGLEMGDIITSVNGFPVHNKDELARLLGLCSNHLELELLRADGQKNLRILRLAVGEQPGILAVPEGTEDSYVELKTRGLLPNWWQKAMSRIRQ